METKLAQPCTGGNVQEHVELYRTTTSAHPNYIGRAPRVVVVVYGTPASIMHRPTRLIEMHRHQEPWRSELAKSAVGADDRREHRLSIRHMGGNNIWYALSRSGYALRCALYSSRDADKHRRPEITSSWCHDSYIERDLEWEKVEKS